VEAADQNAAQTATTTVVIADDHAVVRSGLKTLLDAEPGFEVTGEARDLRSTMTFVRAQRPDVLVLDLNMHDEPSLPAIPDLLAASPKTAIVVLTMQNDPAFAREALRAGALGYVLKECANAELVSAIRAATEGRTYLQPQLGAQLAAEPLKSGDGNDTLSERETEVLQLIALGHTNTEIAEQLYLSVRTVESHRAHIQQKLCLSTRAELVRYALEHDLLDLANGAGK
jgi:two-component system response regulator NreC